MKTLVQRYSFDSAARKITFNGLSAISLEQILLITNVTDNVIIYNFADPAYGGTVSSNVLTLDYNTSAMSNTDDLQIFIDLPNSKDTEDLAEVLMSGFSAVISELQSMRTNQGLPDGSARVRANIETGTINTVATVSTVSNLGSIGGYSTAQYLYNQSNQGWAALRNKIFLS